MALIRSPSGPGMACQDQAGKLGCFGAAVAQDQSFDPEHQRLGLQMIVQRIAP